MQSIKIDWIINLVIAILLPAMMMQVKQKESLAGQPNKL